MFLFNLKLMHDLLQFKMTKALTYKLLSSVVVIMKLCLLNFVNTLEKLSMHFCLTLNVYIYMILKVELLATIANGTCGKPTLQRVPLVFTSLKTDVVTSTTSHLHIPENRCCDEYHQSSSHP